ncbi:unnamed protein product [Taenia asiatica]|uniref:LigB family dioxygenase n=1 Tax=Taenia asiatica TaxID=60517 RepID=A0A0R3W3G5_TAEAS|nr:unnamed protein product [Taenia asiatica]
MTLIISTGAYPHWSVYDSLDTYGDYFNDADRQYGQLQKRFLLGLGLTKNTPGKEIFFASGALKKPYRRQ